MSVISDFASNSVMGVVRKIVNHITGNIDPTLSDAVDHLPSRFHGTFDNNTRNLQLTIESQGTSTEDLVANINIPGGGGSGGPNYSAGNGINITSENAIEIDTAVIATKQSVDTLQAQVGDAFSAVAVGADGKSLDFTALDGQINNIALPSSGIAWVKTTIGNATVGNIIKIKLSGATGGVDETGYIMGMGVKILDSQDNVRIIGGWLYYIDADSKLYNFSYNSVLKKATNGKFYLDREGTDFPISQSIINNTSECYELH
nr:MAG TPA: hypothetical protein [Caudoviricetes sp.]